MYTPPLKPQLKNILQTTYSAKCAMAFHPRISAVAIAYLQTLQKVKHYVVCKIGSNHGA